MMEDLKWGLVLGGGGGKGSYQIGVWKALRELGYENKINAVSGASVGALNTALFGAGDLEMAEDIWENVRQSEFMDLDYEDKSGKIGIFSREGLIRIMKEELSIESVKNSSKILYANASKMVNGDLYAKYFLLNEQTNKEIEQILLASSALPLIYEPVQIGDAWYQDGGLKDNLPILPLYNLGCRNFITVSLGKKMELREALFPGSEFIKIGPSKSLGGFLEGTLDFSSRDSKNRMELGYEDAMLAMNE